VTPEPKIDSHRLASLTFLAVSGTKVRQPDWRECCAGCLSREGQGLAVVTHCRRAARPRNAADGFLCNGGIAARVPKEFPLWLEGQWNIGSGDHTFAFCWPDSRINFPFLSFYSLFYLSKWLFARQALASKCVPVNAHDFPSAHSCIVCLQCSVMVPHSILKQGVPGSILLSGMFFFSGTLALV